jgi:SAM-dependent methyltransferase
MTVNTEVNSDKARIDSSPVTDLCNACGSNKVQSFHQIHRVPVQCNVLWPSRNEALTAQTGTIRLGFCTSCGHVSNLDFDPDIMDYDPRYENSLHFSPRFREYLDELIDDLDRRYSLAGKKVIDVGCGRGDFLKALCQRTKCSGLGFDRSYEATGTEVIQDDVRTAFIVDFYGQAYAHYPVDLLTCRHVLEHIENPREFLSMLKSTLSGHDAVGVFVEVPNALYTVRQLGIWDVIYEHVSYFTEESLSTMFLTAGFDVTSVYDVFGGQFIALHANESMRDHYRKCVKPDAASIESMAEDVNAFQERFRNKVDQWTERIDQIERLGQRAVIWGTGSKGVTFLNALRITDAIPKAVDINPRKHGLFVAGTGQEVVAPESLRDFGPDVVVVMNRIYEHEIRSELDALGLRPEILFA